MENQLSRPINVLFVGDIVGKPGVEITTKLLRSFVEKYHADVCLANGENVTEGKGISEDDALQLFGLGIDALTTGNHLWDRWKARDLLAKYPNILRPLNYPRENGGNGYVILDRGELGKVGVLNLQGRAYMQPIDDPFKTAEWAIAKIREQTNIIIVDFHAEATAEKVALAWHLDGKVSAVLGTHTHIPTADSRILPKGTAYITDVGMTGPYDSVIGMKKEQAIRRFILGTPHKYEVASADVHFSGVILTIDAETGKAQHIEHIFFPSF
ncbi:MAG: TIGR00282 family metallophosphoesterase [Bacteroidota bacterium]